MGTFQSKTVAANLYLRGEEHLYLLGNFVITIQQPSGTLGTITGIRRVNEAVAKEDVTLKTEMTGTMIGRKCYFDTAKGIWWTPITEG